MNTKMDFKKKADKKAVHPYIKTASFYGFLNATEHVKDFKVIKKDKSKAKSASKVPSKELEEKIALMRLYIDKKMIALPSPTMLFYKSPIEREEKDKDSPYFHTFNLDIIGNSKSIAEAIIIETVYVIAKEEFTDHHICVELNTVGDKDSIARLQRELSNYYRKHWNEIPTPFRSLYKKDIFESIRSENKKCEELRENAPDPIRCLSENSRRHFKEVLEYMESLAIPYDINHSLIGDLSFGSETIFQVVATNNKTGEKTILGRGQRYNTVSKKFWGKKDVPSIGASILIKKDNMDCDARPKEVIKKLFFIQLGFEAKIKSLQVLETLRQANIGVVQSLSKDKMTVQLMMAEKMEIPYVIIMGMKEAMEESVVVRNMYNRSQNTVPLTELVSYIKKLK